MRTLFSRPEAVLIYLCDYSYREDENVSLIEIILEDGADVNAGNNQPLKNAIEVHCLNAVKLLLDNGAKVTKEILDSVKDENIVELLKRYM